MGTSGDEVSMAKKLFFIHSQVTACVFIEHKQDA